MIAGLSRWLALRFVTFGMQLVVLAALGRATGPAELGVVQFSFAVFFWLSLANDLGLTVIGARGGRAPSGIAPGDIVGARLLLTIPAIVVAFGVTAIVPILVDRPLIPLMIAAALAAAALSFRWLLQAEERFAAIAVAEMCGAAAQIAAVGALATLGAVGAELALGVLLLPQAVIAVVAYMVIRRLPRLRPRIDLAVLQLAQLALPLGLAGIVTAIHYGADSVILGLMRPPAELGLYAAAYRLVLALLAIPVIVHAVALPVLARHIRNADDTAMRQTLVALASGLLLVALPIAVGTTLIANTLVEAIYGGAFLGAAVPLSLLVWSCVTVSANAVFGAWLLAMRQDSFYLKVALAGALVNVLVNLIVIPVLGPLGAAVTAILSEVVVLGAVVWRTRSYSVPILAAALRQAIPPTLVMAVFAWPVRTSLVAIPLGVLGFAIAAVATGAWHSVRREVSRTTGLGHRL